MDQTALQAMIDRYKTELMETAARSTLPRPEVSAVPAAAAIPEPVAESMPEPIGQPEPEAFAPSPDTEVNPPEAGDGEDPLQPIAPENVTYEEFVQENPKSGTLRIQAFAGRQAVPVSEAQVTVSRRFKDGPHEFASGMTDENGIFDGIVLPAPDKSLAEAPEGIAPYATYDIRVSHPDYRTEIYQQVPIFEGVNSIQPVRFLPDRSQS